MDEFTQFDDFWVRRDNADQDAIVIKEIVHGNSYRVDLFHQRQRSGEIVVDIGAHIGAFAKLWHQVDPMAKIICVEACPENIPVLQRNVGHFAEIIQAACTYEKGDVYLMNSVHPHCINTGGSTLSPNSNLAGIGRDWHLENHFHKDERPLVKLTLEEIMTQVGVNHIDILKLDCEGSEFSILENTPSLSRIGFIVGEYHDANLWHDLRARRFHDWAYGQMISAGELGTFHLRNPQLRHNGDTLLCAYETPVHDLRRQILEAWQRCAYVGQVPNLPLDVLQRMYNVHDLSFTHSEAFLSKYTRFKYAVAEVLQPTRISEIGVGSCLAAHAFVTAAPRALYTGYDNWADSHERGFDYKKWATDVLGEKATLITIDSSVLSKLDNPDFVHVDGDHQPAGVNKEVSLAIDSGAKFILVDDCSTPHVFMGTMEVLCKKLSQFDVLRFDTYTGDVLIVRE